MSSQTGMQMLDSRAGVGQFTRCLRDPTRLELPVSRRLLSHIVIAVLSWALFGYYWGLVAQRRITDNTIRGIQILLVLVLVIWSFTAIWIQHNRRRFAGRPDRRTRRTVSHAPGPTDAIGQTIQIADGAALQAAACVDVSVEVETDPETGTETRRKLFRVADPAGGGDRP